MPAAHASQRYILPSFCPFHFITGIPCPGCGMGRSIICFFHGRFVDSWLFHPLGWIVSTIFVLILIKPEIWQLISRPGGKMQRRLIIACLALLIAAWILRLAHYLPGV